jgi:hypothetical protein
MYRTAERLSNLPFRSSGRIQALILDNVALFTSVPGAASFSVSLRVGQSVQMKITGTSSPGEETIDDLPECLDLFNKVNSVDSDLQRFRIEALHFPIVITGACSGCKA